jgi:hypothetical protein
MSEPAAPAAFADKWRARWPEWVVAETFLPATQRGQAVAWFALLQEFADAAWSGADPIPGLAKLAWWQEELRGWNRGAYRHPLGALLPKQDAPWTQLADALSALRDRASLHDAVRMPPAYRSFGQGIVETELAVFGPPATVADAATSALLAERIALDRPDAATALRDAMREATAGARPRRLLSALVRARLSRLAAGAPWEPLSRWRALRTAWRAARG